MKILSIDWDYFIDCTFTDRVMKFPDGGNENIGIAMSTYIWATRYACCPEIADIKVRSKEIDALKKIVEHNKQEYFFICADSHQHLGEFILNEDMEQKIKKEGITIVNIDHHHDMFGLGEELNCGNWLNKVLDKYPEATVKWIHNDDSDIEDFVGTESTDMNDASGEYDVIYLCRSAIWSPPHLDKEFGVLNRFIAKRCAYPIFRQEIMNRWDSEYKKDIEVQKAQIDESRRKLSESLNLS